MFVLNPTALVKIAEAGFIGVVLSSPSLAYVNLTTQEFLRSLSRLLTSGTLAELV
jgi:hypothetical protein